MHTYLQRLNAVGTFAGTVLAAFAGLVAITGMLTIQVKHAPRWCTPTKTTTTGLLHRSNPTAQISLNAIEGLQREFGVDRVRVVVVQVVRPARMFPTHLLPHRRGRPCTYMQICDHCLDGTPSNCLCLLKWTMQQTSTPSTR